jgi:WhiB family redox-sensing transcriptional regulator
LDHLQALSHYQAREKTVALHIGVYVFLPEPPSLHHYNVCFQERSVSAMDWRHRAVCRDEDPELFFPIGTSGPALLQVEQAKAVCRRCSAVDECLQWALESGQDAGVWGGMSEEERRAVKRRGGIRVRASI